ncbi:MAG: ATP-binding protein [Clostridium sp.]|uniref:ATP-binding protein n=1 Tax=Clostridium sp. TaxID=1506 RepID=UPI00290516B9|nr:ATP-binding protein [Clostridium sp.]MDU1605515.1 ATP-binding protein [Clostridium sp.]
MSISDYFTKEFSIKSLTKGTTILDAICCLIDNSLDAAEKSKKEKINIKIFLDKDQLLIMDNALGISLDEAKSNMLKVGEKNSFKDLYGNGMKKAILVIGKDVEIRAVKDKLAINIKLNVLDKKDNQLWEPQFSDEVYAEEEDSFLIRISNFRRDMIKIMKKGRNHNFINELKQRLGYKYRYIIKSNKANIVINGDVLEARYVEATKVAEKNKTIDGMKIIVKLFKDIKDKSENGADFIINDRCVVEKEKSNKISWGMKIRKRGHSYVKFYGEVLIDADDIETLGVNPSRNKINFSTHKFNEVLKFMLDVIEENRNAYKKGSITVQLEIDEEEYLELKNILESRQFNRIPYECAKDVVEYIYDLGVNKVKEHDQDL